MEETYPTAAIVLKRQPFRENDLRAEVYSLERGKLELVARGAKKSGSKLAGHLEPFNLSRLMVVRGRQFDYIGGAAAVSCFTRLKSDPDRISAAGLSCRLTAALVKAGIEDRNIYHLLSSLFQTCDNTEKKFDAEILYYAYAFKLISFLGYRPVLACCLMCENPVETKPLFFDPRAGGLLCSDCRKKGSAGCLTITAGSVKLLRFINEHSLEQTADLAIGNQAKTEIKKAISSFTKYQLSLEL